MAENIPAGAPPAPQLRRQVADANGNFVPYVAPAETPKKPSNEPDLPEFKVGDAVRLFGRVTEVNSPQGGQTQVKVQLRHNGGALWMRVEHVEPDVPAAPVAAVPVVAPVVAATGK